MAYWGGAMNYVGGVMTARAKEIAQAKRVALRTDAGKALVKQALIDLKFQEIRSGKGIESIFKGKKRPSTGPKKPRTKAQREATERMIIANQVARDKREFGEVRAPRKTYKAAKLPTYTLPNNSVMMNKAALLGLM